MKNIRACHALGIRTVLIDEAGGTQGGEAELLGDTVDATDPAVAAVLQHIGQIGERLPGLFDRRFL